MTPNERFKSHFEFLDQLDEAIGAALKQYHGAEESDLEELRHLQREVGLARRTLAALCKKFTQPLGEKEAPEQASSAAEPQEPPLAEKSAAV